MQIIALGEGFDPALLDRVYREVYLPAFPRPEEQESPAIWTPKLRDPAHSNPRLLFLVAGQRLHDPAEAEPLGLLVGEYYRRSRCVLFSYVAIQEGHRGRGLAGRLFARARELIASGAASDNQPVQALFAEVHDPGQMSAAQDVMDPVARWRMMHRFGARRVPVPYLQPALQHGQDSARGLVLIALPMDGGPLDALSADTLADFLDEFLRSLDVADPRLDPEFAPTFAALASLAATRPDRLIPLQRLADD